MAFWLPLAAWAAGGAGAALGGYLGVIKWKESHPLVRSERLAWAKGHTLNVDMSKERELCNLVDLHFVRGQKIELCFEILAVQGFTYEHWFVKRGNWIVEFGNGHGFSDHQIVVHCNRKTLYYTKKTLSVTDDVIERMKKVVGATSYSLLLRNCEHVANYIFEARWVSLQTLQEGCIGAWLLEFVTAPEHRALRNLLPDELALSAETCTTPIYPDLPPRVKYSIRDKVLDASDKEAYNVVVLGPTGAGKSTIINLILNRHVCRAADDVDSVTRNIEFLTGQGMTPDGRVRRINLIDSIGFCDSHLDPKEVYEIIKETIKGNCIQLHKVLIVVSGRLQKDHQESIKQILGWLRYDPTADTGPSFSVMFIYTKCDEQTEERKQHNLMRVCDLLGATTGQMSYYEQDRRIDFTNAFALSFPPRAPMEAILDDYDKLMSSVFKAPTEPIIINRQSCAIL